MNEDFYDILNLPDNAPAASIARASQARLREIAQDTDMTPDQKQAATAAVYEAHETLSDTERRAQYDVHLQQVRDESTRSKPAVKKHESFSYPKIGLALTIIFAIGYFSITGYLGHQQRLENERNAAAMAESKKLASEQEERNQKAAVREAEARVLAEQKRIDQERMLNERGIKTDKYLPQAK